MFHENTRILFFEYSSVVTPFVRNLTVHTPHMNYLLFVLSGHEKRGLPLNNKL